MGYDMSIAALSVSMNQQQNNMNLGVAALKMAMETSEASVTDMLESIDVSAITGTGVNIDISG